MMLALLGACWVRMGRAAQGAYNLHDNRAVQVGLDLACFSLAELGEVAFAASVLDWAEQARQAERHEWSVAERLLVDRVRSRAPKKYVRLDPKTEPKTVLNEVARTLRRSAQSAPVH
ncbi:MAG: hypothetical protein M9921_13285 [Fimbriimonadaceae bacterium]|nr:hypothetical protein [Fimbriimonadaceae bacterium]